MQAEGRTDSTKCRHNLTVNEEIEAEERFDSSQDDPLKRFQINHKTLTRKERRLGVAFTPHVPLKLCGENSSVERELRLFLS